MCYVKLREGFPSFLLDELHLLFEGHVAGVQHDRVGGRFEGCDGPRRVSLIAPLEVGHGHRYLGSIGFDAVLKQTAFGAFFHPGNQKYLDCCIRKHHGPDVASVENGCR